jgi:hypothetical protein
MKFTNLSCPRLCPPVVLVNVGWRPRGTVGSEEGKVTESGLMVHLRK